MIMGSHEKTQSSEKDRGSDRDRRFGEEHRRSEQNHGQINENDNVAKQDSDDHHSRQGYRNSDEFGEEEARLIDGDQMDDHSNWRNHQVTRVDDDGNGTLIKRRKHSVEKIETRQTGRDKRESSDE
jgi:hypothetical protein